MIAEQDSCDIGFVFAGSDGFFEVDVGVVVEKVSLETGKPLYNNPLLIVLNEKAEVLLRKQLVQVSEHPATLRTDGEILTLSSGGSQVRVDVREIE